MSGILAGLSAGLGAFSSFLGYKGQKEANETNIRLQREQNDFTERMWEKNNAYNDPSHQMQRLMAAGISPTFAGQTVNGGEAQQVTGQAPAHVENAYGSLSNDVDNVISQLSNLQLLDSQINLNDTRAKNEKAQTLADIALKGKKAGLLDSQTVYQDILNMFVTEREGYKTAEQKASLAKSAADIALARQKAIESKNMQEKIKADTQLAEINKKLLPQLSAAQMYSLRMNAKAALTNAATQQNLSKHQASQLDALKDRLTEEVLGAKSQSEISKIEAEFAKELGCDPKTAAMFTSAILGVLTKIKF